MTLSSAAMGRLDRIRRLVSTTPAPSEDLRMRSIRLSPRSALVPIRIQWYNVPVDAVFWFLCLGEISAKYDNYMRILDGCQICFFGAEFLEMTGGCNEIKKNVVASIDGLLGTEGTPGDATEIV